MSLHDAEQPELKRNNQESRYEILVEGQLAGFATYADVDGARELPHTFVDPKFRGQGLSSPLMQYALDDARSEGLTVVPTCPAVARYIAQNPEYADLVE
ncbi:GNAT family N-acetyltransferase [Corynebacterium sp. NML130628]|uniref:GNAT family N-acetyltransferase n=1 Tax=Corynebacterium sp. NML130628 TaxID=1906333 RepID=UPI0008FB8633|nr:GNAT family N-acetyltransferase [Corynebacterium sp. NML130628]